VAQEFISQYIDYVNLQKLGILLKITANVTVSLVLEAEIWDLC